MNPGSIIATLALSVLVATTPSQSSDGPPDEYLHPTDHLISRSIMTYDPSGSVKPMTHVSTDAEETVITFTSDVLFEVGSAVVPDSAAAAVVEALEDIPPDAAVDVSGHTDSTGETAANQTLSEQRAQSVAALITNARPDLLLTITGYGENRPVASNGDVDGRALNRRVEVRYVG